MLRIFKKLDAKQLYTIYAVRVTIFATLSTVVAYFLASLTVLASPIIAAILSLSSIKPTFHDTVRESVRQIVGTFFGAIFGLLFISFFGFNLLTLAIIVATSFIAGWILKLRAEGGITIAVTVILVSGPLLGDLESIEQRLFGVIIGAICALIASYLIMPASPHKQILQVTIEQGEKTSKLLKKIGVKFSKENITKETVESWLEEINTIIETMKENRENIRTTLKDAKWAPLLRKKDVKDVVDQVTITMRNANNVRSIIEGINKALENDAKITPKIKENISLMLVEAAKGIKTQARKAIITPADKIDKNDTEKIRSKRQKLASEIRNLEDTQAILLSGTLIHETTNIKDSISEEENIDFSTKDADKNM